MEPQTSSSTVVSSTARRTKLRAVVYGGGIGMFPPLMQRFCDEVEIGVLMSVRIPQGYALGYRFSLDRLAPQCVIPQMDLLPRKDPGGISFAHAKRVAKRCAVWPIGNM
jgi:hypothetical protein